MNEAVEQQDSVAEVEAPTMEDSLAEVEAPTMEDSLARSRSAYYGRLPG